MTLEFKGGPTGRSKLELPSEWAGEKHTENSVTELKADSADVLIRDTQSPAEKELEFPPNAVVRISYVLVKDWSGLLNGATRFRADLEPEYFHLIGTTSLVHPNLDSSQPVDVHFDWQKLPQTWSLATSFGTDDRCQSFHGTWFNAVNSLFAGGDYRIHHSTVSGKTVNFAIRGTWSFSDEEWVENVRRIIEFERSFWHDNNFPYFLVTLTPFGADHGSQGGTALTNAFMEHLSRQDPISPGILAQLAHETFHSWTPGKMGKVPDTEEWVSWFYEGFTGYYQDLMLLRAGLLTFPDYVATLNDKLRGYETSDDVQVGLLEFVRRHAADHSIFKQLEYRRGTVLAAWLDAAIREQSHNKSSLDNLMFDFVAQESRYQRSHHGSSLSLTNDRILRAAAKYIRPASLDFLRKHVEQGGSIQLPEDALGSCVKSHSDLTEKFDPGFDLQSLKSADKLVSGVEPDGEAYKAGLRDGQQLAAWSFTPDPEKQMRLTIRFADGKQVLTYFPRGARVPVQQFTLDAAKYSADPKTCSVGL